MKPITRFLSCLLLLACAAAAQALELKPYSAEALALAEKANLPVALHFRADWCPTCRAQDQVLQGLAKGPEGARLPLTVLKVDYDTEKALKQRFDVRAQSTIVVLRGAKERARLAGDVTEAGIRGALKAAL